MSENLTNEPLNENENLQGQVTENGDQNVSESPVNKTEPEHSEADFTDVVFDSESPMEVVAENISEDQDAQEETKEEEEFFVDDLDLDNLSAKFHALWESGEILNSRANFRKIQDRFHTLVDDLKNQAFESYMAEGGEKDYFEFKAGELADNLRTKLDEIGKRFIELRRKKEQELQENFLKKQDIIQELKQLIENEADINKAHNLFRELQERWKNTGQVISQKAEELNNNYRHWVNMFYRSLQMNKELFTVELKKNVEIKERIVKGAESLQKMSSINKALEFLHDYQKQWRETGPVPRAENEELWQRFKKASDAVIIRRDEHIKQLNEERTKNLEIKTGLCEEMESIAAGDYPTMKDFREAEKKVTDLDKRWRATGRVANEFNESIWQRFREARKAFNAKRTALIQQSESVFKKNLADKEALCEKAEAIQDSTDWKNTTQAFLKLQEDWKKTGPVSREVSEKIWQRFRAAANHFFNKKEEHFKAIPEQEKQNLEAKRAVIEKINAYEHTAEVSESFAAMNALRKEFNAIGFVPMKEKAALDKEMDDAVKAFFAKINVDPAEKNRIEFKGRIDALVAAPDAMDQIRKERTAIRLKMEKLLEEVNQLENNIRFFGNSKNAEEVTKPYREKAERLKEDIKQLEDKQNQLKRAAKQLETK
ncbi:MAG: DUF349 domain-containing protein [Flavobacteriales bacterium]|nr:DUF349 domain-containing protein [Flavobacteriales bacterium]